MNNGIPLNRIIDFLDDDIVSIIGKTDNIVIKNLNACKDVNRYSLDWINKTQKDKQLIAEKSKASVIICTKDVKYSDLLKINNKSLIVVADPKLSIIKIGNYFFLEQKEPVIHPSAIIHPKAKLGENVSIGANVTIGKCIIGDLVVILDNVVIHDDVIVGNEAVIKSGAVLGSEGFGFERDTNGELIKFPQIGKLFLGDKIEVGANTCIDRGALSDTVIGYGTKINNLCHIAHNVTIGKNVIITAHVNISGSTTIHDDVWIAPNASLRGHQTIGKGAVIGMSAVVTKDVPAGEIWVGNPARKLEKF